MEEKEWQEPYPNDKMNHVKEAIIPPSYKLKTWWDKNGEKCERYQSNNNHSVFQTLREDSCLYKKVHVPAGVKE